MRALGHNTAGVRGSHERGFTLFEVAISTVLVTFGVVSVMMLLPSGLKAQQFARYQIHAAVVMQNMAMKLSNPGQQMFNVQVEAEKLTNNLYLNRSAASLESIAEGSNLQLAPLPAEIGRRIDSDHDEINRIVADGGRIYYNLPGGPPQGLIVGFVGYEQQNALPNHPSMAWPYWEHHPAMVSAWELSNWKLNPSWPGQQEIQDLYDIIGGDPNPKDTAKLNLPDGGPINASRMPVQKDITKTSWARYCDAAIKLVQAVAKEPNSGLTLTSVTGKRIENAPGLPGTGGGSGVVLEPPMPFPERDGGPLGAWKLPGDAAEAEKLRRNLYPRPYVALAASHLAFAVALGTGTIADSFDAMGVQQFDKSKPPKLVYRYYDNGPNLTADELAYARRTYESARQWVTRAATADPYNWGMGRPVAQQNAWDFPLVQHDLFPAGSFAAYVDPTSDPVVVPPDPPRQDTAWRVVTPRRVTLGGPPILTSVDDYGQARGLYGSRPPPNTPVFLPANKGNIDQGWGDPSHFHLTRRFDPAERMRQVVFWSVDWQSYEDFEELPSPRHDASMGFKDSYGVQVSSDWWGIGLPERGNYWADATRTTKAGSLRGATGTNQTFDTKMVGGAYFCDSSEYKAGYFMGIHGADRNGNGKCDRGSVPKSVRLRATQVARFTIYDRVLLGELRH